jgi:hypothetical protein
MATAKPLSTSPRRRGLRKALLIVVVLLAVLLAVSWSALRGHAVAGASVGARVACSCRFVGGRDLSDCRKDFEPGMGVVMLSQDEAARSVTARVPLLSSQTATYRQGEGCMLEKWSH